jgi:hypothetical protein
MQRYLPPEPGHGSPIGPMGHCRHRLPPDPATEIGREWKYPWRLSGLPRYVLFQALDDWIQAIKDSLRAIIAVIARGGIRWGAIAGQGFSWNPWPPSHRRIARRFGWATRPIARCQSWRNPISGLSAMISLAQCVGPAPPRAGRGTLPRAAHRLSPAAPVRPGAPPPVLPDLCRPCFPPAVLHHEHAPAHARRSRWPPPIPLVSLSRPPDVARAERVHQPGRRGQRASTKPPPSLAHFC